MESDFKIEFWSREGVNGSVVSLIQCKIGWMCEGSYKGKNGG